MLPTAIQDEEGRWYKDVIVGGVPHRQYASEGDVISHKFISAKQMDALKSITKSPARRGTNPLFTSAIMPQGKTPFCNGLQPEYIARLCYLSIFMSYNGMLMTGFNRDAEPMTLKTMQSALKLKRQTFDDFIKSVMCQKVDPSTGEVLSDGYIVKGEDGLYMNPAYFVRGNISDGQTGCTIKLFHEGVYHLYNSVDQKSHRAIGMMFALMPFLNVYTNILCYGGSFQKEITDIVPITSRQFASVLNLSVSHSKKLYEGWQLEMLNLMLDVNDDIVPVCRQIPWGKSKALMIEPSLLFAPVYEPQITDYFTAITSVRNANIYSLPRQSDEGFENDEMEVI